MKSVVWKTDSIFMVNFDKSEISLLKDFLFKIRIATETYHCLKTFRFTKKINWKLIAPMKCTINLIIVDQTLIIST